MPKQEENSNKTPIYMQLANDINAQIDDGIYQAGERLSSVRNMAAARGLSVTTVIRAYQELENRNMITVIPQSGYYISYKKARFLPNLVFDITKPQAVDVIDLVNLVLHDSSDETLLAFGSGIPPADFLPVGKLNKLVGKALHSTKYKANYTGNAEGSLFLRSLLVRKMYSLNTQVTPSEILITSGCNEAVYLAFAAICQPGDEVAVESPCYFGVLQILQELNLKVIEISSDSQDGINLENLEIALERYNIKAIYVNSNCNNPLGSSIPLENKKALVKIINQFKVPLIEDDINGDLYFGKSRPEIIKAFDTEGRVIYCSSFSKTLAPSFRIGWIIPGRYIEQITRLKQAINIGTTFIFQIAIADYLDSGQTERHLRKIRNYYSARVKKMSEDIIENFPEYTFVSTPQGAYNLWVQLPKRVNSLKLYNEAKKLKISITPGSIFSTDDKYANYMRLSAASYSNEMEVFIKTLGELTDKLQHEST